jgi:hypothetical protein
MVNGHWSLGKRKKKKEKKAKNAEAQLVLI